MRKKEAIKVWQSAGLMALTSLEDEVRAQAEATGIFLMPDADPKQGKRFLQVIKAVGVERDPVAQIQQILSEALLPNSSLTPLQKRMRYRQSLITAGALLQSQDRARQCLEDEAKALDLPPLDMSWTDSLQEAHKAGS